MRGLVLSIALVLTLVLPAVVLAAEEATTGTGNVLGISNLIILLGVGAVVVIGFVAVRRNGNN